MRGGLSVTRRAATPSPQPRVPACPEHRVHPPTQHQLVFSPQLPQSSSGVMLQLAQLLQPRVCSCQLWLELGPPAAAILHPANDDNKPPSLPTLHSPLSSLHSILHVSSASDSLSNCISWQPRPASARTPDPSEQLARLSSDN